MCHFFSFITKDGARFYFDAPARRKAGVWTGERNDLGVAPDSHSFLASHFALPVDKVNKYEFDFVTGKFTVDQINIEDDRERAEAWVRTLKFTDLLDPMATVRENGRALGYVPANLRSKALLQSAVERAGYALSWVPMELRSKELCLVAVKQNGCALEFVPENLRDRILCLSAVEQTGTALRRVPMELRDREMCMAAIKSTGVALGSVPVKLLSKELCLAAVKQTPVALQYVPDELWAEVAAQAKRR